MFKLFKSINFIFWKPITWNHSPKKDGKFFTEKYPKNEYWLQMNDFPEEPLWTVFLKGDSKDFDNTPIFWKINF